MIEYIYVIIAITWVVVLIGFLAKEIWILMFSGLIMTIIGIYTLTNGFVGNNNLAVTAFSFLHVGLGFYLLMRSVEEVLKQ